MKVVQTFFEEFFAFIFTTGSSNINKIAFDYQQYEAMFDMIITQETTLTELNNLNIYGSTGPDDIPAIILNICNDGVLMPILYLILKKSYDE